MHGKSIFARNYGVTVTLLKEPVREMRIEPVSVEGALDVLNMFGSLALKNEITVSDSGLTRKKYGRTFNYT